MSDLNHCTFIGRVGKDPETRYITNGDAVTSFTIACTDRWKDKASGEKKENTEWVRCIAWRQLAEISSQYLAKGSLVFVSGKMQTRKWTDKNGQERYTTEIVVDKMQMLDNKSGSSSPNKVVPKEQAQTRQQATKAVADLSDDIPFRNPYQCGIWRVV